MKKKIFHFVFHSICTIFAPENQIIHFFMDDYHPEKRKL